jgi:hypothetical protein
MTSKNPKSLLSSTTGVLTSQMRDRVSIVADRFRLLPHGTLDTDGLLSAEDLLQDLCALVTQLDEYLDREEQLAEFDKAVASGELPDPERLAARTPGQVAYEQWAGMGGTPWKEAVYGQEVWDKIAAAAITWTVVSIHRSPGHAAYSAWADEHDQEENAWPRAVYGQYTWDCIAAAVRVQGKAS